MEHLAKLKVKKQSDKEQARLDRKERRRKFKEDLPKANSVPELRDILMDVVTELNLHEDE